MIQQQMIPQEIIHSIKEEYWWVPILVAVLGLIGVWWSKRKK